MGRDGFVKLLMLDVIGVLESSPSNRSSTLTSILLGIFIRLGCIYDGFCFAVDGIFNFDCLARAVHLDGLDDLIWVFGQVWACLALLSPNAFVATQDAVFVVSVTRSCVDRF